MTGESESEDGDAEPNRAISVVDAVCCVYCTLKHQLREWRRAQLQPTPSDAR